MSDDLIGWIEDELREQRSANAIGYDRAEALAALRGLAIETAAGRGRTWITPAELHDDIDSEPRRALVDALFNRIIPNAQEATP